MTEVSPQGILDILAVEASCLAPGRDSGDQLHAMQFEELGYDSLAVLQLMSEIEKRYSISLPSEAMEEMKTPDEAADFVNNQIKTQRG